eukprot:Tbor_TRINITY_DN5446_c1_g3::TRINITY_DN5446_c1_g3_i1::g.25338::m.25338/K18466/VPS26; vacuolar protein sorting-associated protein 26
MLKRDRPPEKEKSGGFFNKILRKVDGCDISFHFDGKDEDSKVVIDDPYDKTSERMHLFSDKDVISGKVRLNPKGNNFKHLGILIDFVGVVTILSDREEKKAFINQEKHVEADTLVGPSDIAFKFDVPKEYESYRGINAKVQYLVKLTIQRSVKNVFEEEEVWVSKMDEELTESQPDTSEQTSYFRETAFGPTSVSMEVGVDQALHIEFKYNKKMFHLKERVLGKVTFKVMELDLQHGEVGIVRKEFIGPGNPNDAVEQETLQKFEIMDGSPHKGEVLPIRLYLNSIPFITPTYQNR